MNLKKDGLARYKSPKSQVVRAPSRSWVRFPLGTHCFSMSHARDGKRSYYISRMARPLAISRAKWRAMIFVGYKDIATERFSLNVKIPMTKFLVENLIIYREYGSCFRKNITIFSTALRHLSAHSGSHTTRTVSLLFLQFIALFQRYNVLHSITFTKVHVNILKRPRNIPTLKSCNVALVYLRRLSTNEPCKRCYSLHHRFSSYFAYRHNLVKYCYIKLYGNGLVQTRILSVFQGVPSEGHFHPQTGMNLANIWMPRLLPVSNFTYWRRPGPYLFA